MPLLNQRSFVTNNIIGAMKMEQLKENIDSINIELSSEVLEQVNEIHKEISPPCP